MTIEIKKNAPACTIELAGRLDTTTAPMLDKVVTEELAGITDLVLDIKGLEYMATRPASAVNSEKQRKIISVSKQYRATHPFKGRMRYDIIEVYLEDGKRRPMVKEIKHLEAAFNLDTAYDAKYYYKRKKEGSVL